jgi:hypothetical protein
MGNIKTRQTGKRATMRIVEKRVMSGLIRRKYDRAEYE